MGKDSKAKGGAKGGDAKGGAKGGKGDKKGGEAAGGAKEKGGGCSSINVRHILCEKQGKCMEAMAKLQAGERLELEVVCMIVFTILIWSGLVMWRLLLVRTRQGREGL